MKSYQVVYDRELVDGQAEIPSDLEGQMGDLYHKVMKGKLSVKNKLDKLLKRFPNVPILWNYQVSWHVMNGNVDRARAINKELLQKFPNYLYARMHEASCLILEDNLEEAHQLLGGGELDLSTLYPNRTAFHITEFKAYTKIAIEYLAATRQFERADDCIKELKLEKFDADFISLLEDNLFHIRMKHNFDRMKEMQEKEIHNITIEIPTLPQIQENLQPYNDQFAYLYELDLWEIDLKQLQNDIDKNREALLTEVNYILHKAIEVTNYVMYVGERNPAAVNAALLLGYLDDKNGLEKVFSLLRQPEDVFGFWFEDQLNEIISVYFRNPSDSLLHSLKGFITEPLVCAYPKTVLLEGLKIMVQIDASYHAKVSHVLEEMMEVFLNEKDNEELMDSDVVAFMVGAAIDIHVVMLLPMIEKLYNEGLVSESVEGDFEEAKKNLLSIKKEKSPVKVYSNIADHLKDLLAEEEKMDYEYNRTYEESDHRELFDEGDYDDFEEDELYNDNSLLKANTSVKLYSQTPRNAPCPCGSGKKYKRCHGQ